MKSEGDSRHPNGAGDFRSSSVAAWIASVQDHQRNGAGDPIRSLDLIAAGIQVRRQLDATPAADPGADAERRALQNILLGLQHASYRWVSMIKPFTPPHDAVASWVSDKCRSEGSWLSKLLTDPEVTALRRTGLLDAFVDDLAWYSGVAASLEGQHWGDGTGRIQVRLSEISEWLGNISAATEEKQQHLWSRRATVEVCLLERRVAAELERTAGPASPEHLWMQRFALSRLRLDLQRLQQDRSIDVEQHAKEVMEAITKIDQRREEIAERVETSLQGLTPRLRAEALADITVCAQGEANEIATQIEDVGLDEAVRILEVGRGDFRRLERSARLLLPSFEVSDPAAKEARRKCRRVHVISHQVRNELQDKRLSLRLEGLFGRTFVAWLERIVLVLVLVLALLIAAEWLLDLTIGLSEWQRACFAWADLGICTIFLFEFALKLTFAEGKFRYLRRRFLVDFVASIPFGFLTWQFTSLHSPAAEAPQLLRLLRLLRLPSLVRYLRIAQPFVRVARLILFAMRITDGLVRQYADLFNRNIILFEPGSQETSRHRYRDDLESLATLFRRSRKLITVGLQEDERLVLASRALCDLEHQMQAIESLSAPAVAFDEPADREIPVEDVVERLIEMTPEEILDTMGLPFADSVRRWTRLFNVPLIRRLPMIRELLEYREKGPGEVAALAANFLGHIIQGFLNIVYFFADLQATISPPIFLDRLGATLVLATARPAKRLLIFGAALVLLSLFVWPIPTLQPVVSWIDERLVRPIFIVGLLCLVPLFLGTWLRRVANQAAEFCERVVEAQFAAQTKKVKDEHRAMDLRFLSERVIDPELALRKSDETKPQSRMADSTSSGTPGDFWATDAISQEETLFLQTMKLLYNDYLDGSMLHQSDTKTTTQLLGNLALSNFRLSNLTQGLAIQKRLQALDLNRSAGKILGGPFLWFNFITRAITQQTARLLIDYNRHAIPLARLACASREEREHYRGWLSRRLGVDATEIRLPDPIGTFGDQPGHWSGPRNPRAEEFFHTVDFMAIDFLTADPERDELIRSKYGEQLFHLLERDRQANVRKAFRSYPLHDVPLAIRTVNPLTLYETYFADGRVIYFPFRLAWWTLQYAIQSLFHLHKVIRDILDPEVFAEPNGGGGDNYDVARRKIHRMRKPVFMESLWLRARFDIEYVGLAIPHVPLPAPARCLLDDDLDFIGATRRERTAADRLRLDHRQRLHWISDWLDRLGWDFERLSLFLAKDYPFLADRAAEVMRAMVTAALLDHDDLYTLASSIEGLQRLFDFARNPAADLARLPEGLPESVHIRRRFWYHTKARGKKTRDLFKLPCFPKLTSDEQSRVLKLLRKHRAVSRGWVRILLGQGGPDPEATLRSRWRDVISRTGVWSDQFIALRTIQTLTMLDVFHYCDLVWKLGGFERIEQEQFGHQLPWITPAADREFSGPLTRSTEDR